MDSDFKIKNYVSFPRPPAKTPQSLNPLTTRGSKRTNPFPYIEYFVLFLFFLSFSSPFLVLLSVVGSFRIACLTVVCCGRNRLFFFCPFFFIAPRGIPCSRRGCLWGWRLIDCSPEEIHSPLGSIFAFPFCLFVLLLSLFFHRSARYPLLTQGMSLGCEAGKPEPPKTGRKPTRVTKGHTDGRGQDAHRRVDS